MILKLVAVGGFLYFVCVAWNIPLTSWLASAGVIGIAVGFAAKDTLSNLFAGIFIVADSPYKVGDFVVLDNTTRGQVLEIGIRSTRLLTRDDVEITVPNAVIANSQIVNQTGGPAEKMRVRVKVEAAYGSDVDQVEKVLLGSVEGVEHVCRRPGAAGSLPGVRRIGSGLRVAGVGRRAGVPGRVLHALNSNVYKNFNAAGIEIPFSKQDVYIKQMPGGGESKMKLVRMSVIGGAEPVVLVAAGCGYVATSPAKPRRSKCWRRLSRWKFGRAGSNSATPSSST